MSEIIENYDAPRLCPVCKSENISYGKELGHARQKMWCNNCAAYWVYKWPDTAPGKRVIESVSDAWGTPIEDLTIPDLMIKLEEKHKRLRSLGDHGDHLKIPITWLDMDTDVDINAAAREWKQREAERAEITKSIDAMGNPNAQLLHITIWINDTSACIRSDFDVTLTELGKSELLELLKNESRRQRPEPDKIPKVRINVPEEDVE